MKSCSIHDLLRLALPFGTKVLAGNAGLGRHVEHAVSLRATLPAFPMLRGGELVVLSVQEALALDDGLTLTRIVRRLGGVAVAAIAVVGAADDEALEAADSAGLPLLQLPAQVTPRSVERDVLLLLDKPEMQIERRADQLYGELTHHIARGAGIEAVLCTVHEVTGRAVAYYDAARELRMQYGSYPAPAIFAALRPEAGRQVMGRDTLIIRAIGKSALPLGYIALGGSTIDLWDELAAERAATALALELSKQQAVQAVEARASGDLLRGLIDGYPLDISILHQQASDLGYDLKFPHVAVLIAPIGSTTTTEELRRRLQQELVAQQTNAPFVEYENMVLCLYPDDERLVRIRKLLAVLSEDLMIGAGISAPAANAANWQRAYTEAQQALALGRQLFGPNNITAFGDLHVYRLLAELRGSPSLSNFHHSILGPLVEYDRRHNTTLLDTLEGYFAAQGNLREAAEQLAIHRNTLLYRLRRIGQIGQIDLERTEDALALQIALKAHRILTLPGANGSNGHIANGSYGNGKLE